MQMTTRIDTNRPNRVSLLRGGLALAIALAVLVAGQSAWADDHDPKAAGHPVRIAAYVLHPVGWLLDKVLVKPAHWVVSKKPMKEIFGHKD